MWRKIWLRVSMYTWGQCWGLISLFEAYGVAPRYEDRLSEIKC
jgi:hypothetical protein